MTRFTTFLYTFIDQETGGIADTVAPNESAARLSLGGDWILRERCPLFSPPAEVGKRDEVVKEALDEAAKAFDDMNAARPQPGTITTPELLAAFSDAAARYEQKKARVAKLVKMSLSPA